MERASAVTMKGNRLTLVGPELKEGDKAPDFSALDNGLSEVRLTDSNGKARLISVVPSLDTPVCSTQTKTFNDQLNQLGDKVAAYTVSADLPFAQGRFCSSEGISNMKVISDYRDMDFGEKYGLKIKELRLLARAVLVVDKNDTITHMQIVPEVTQEPDYTTAMEALKKAAAE
jgi:thioredoxin-dependent peroxiredoxin